MGKLAQVVVDVPVKDSLKDSDLESEHLHLKEMKEEEIRMKLDEFARELSQVKAKRDKH